MRIRISVDEHQVEISDSHQRYQPDVLADWMARANEAMRSQRTFTLALEKAPDPDTGSAET
ncbi:MAG TPA: hypothetical protein VJ742_12900 [Nitrososphaera sp.]|nr:hypothetical protein [Nitrososphaera sp.]